MAGQPQQLRLEWQAATPGERDGTLALYLDGRLALWLDGLAGPGGQPAAVVLQAPRFLAIDPER